MLKYTANGECTPNPNGRCRACFQTFHNNGEDFLTSKVRELVPNLAPNEQISPLITFRFLCGLEERLPLLGHAQLVRTPAPKKSIFTEEGQRLFSVFLPDHEDDWSD